MSAADTSYSQVKKTRRCPPQAPTVLASRPSLPFVLVLIRKELSLA